jgi:hypothetical protein
VIVFRAGSILEKKSLGGILRARWDENRKAVLSIIERRKATGTPLDDGDGALSDPGEYRGDAELDGVIVSIRALSVADHQVLTSSLVAASKAIEEATGAARDTAIIDESLVCRTALEKCISSIEGLSDGDERITVRVSPTMSDSDWEMLGASGLVQPLITACMWIQSVRGEQKKTSGSLAPSTSEKASIAIDVLKGNGDSRAVTMTRPPTGSFA